MGQEKMLEKKIIIPKKRAEEPLVSIFFLSFYHVFAFGIFRFGVCMIEAISCTQTEFFIDQDQSLFKMEDHKVWTGITLNFGL